MHSRREDGVLLPFWGSPFSNRGPEPLLFHPMPFIFLSFSFFSSVSLSFSPSSPFRGARAIEGCGKTPTCGRHPLLLISLSFSCATAGPSVTTNPRSHHLLLSPVKVKIKVYEQVWDEASIEI